MKKSKKYKCNKLKKSILLTQMAMLTFITKVQATDIVS